MRVFTLAGTQVQELPALPEALPAQGFVWIACSRTGFAQSQSQLQRTLERLCGHTLVDLHISDLLNAQLPSHYDFTSQYDVLVFRRLATSGNKSGASPVLERIDTSPVGFALFDRLLLSVHPDDCAVRDAFATTILMQPKARVNRECTNTIFGLQNFTIPDYAEQTKRRDEACKDPVDVWRYFCLAGPEHVPARENAPRGRGF